MQFAASTGISSLMRSLILLPVLLAPNSVCAQSWTPDVAIISKLETGIKPSDRPLRYSPGHLPVVGQYARYYFGYKANNHRMISGEFVFPFGTKMKPAGIYMVGSERGFPTIFDGGCSVIHVVYDVEEVRMVSLQCNGVA